MQKENNDFTIIYEDQDVCVVDKPAGLLSVPIPNSSAKNLFDLVSAHYKNQRLRIGCVHRIDRYTSGLMVFSKHNDAYELLLDQFKDHTPERCYLALVRGLFTEEEGEYTHHLKKVKEGFRNIVVEADEEGAAPARLTFRIKEHFLNTTLVEVYLDTGLKNQIRVQFEAEGHQLVGDQHYAPEEEEEELLNRQALHAYRLGFIHPSTKERVTYQAPLPPDMLRLIDHYRWQKEIRPDS